MIPAQYATDLGDSNWKVRLAALEEMTGWMESAAPELDSEVVVRFLGKKGWNEKNFQVGLAVSMHWCPFSLARPRCRRSCTVSSISLRSIAHRLGDHQLRSPSLIFPRNWAT